MTLKLGFSPCPNDTFIFDALVNGKIDTEGLAFEPVLEDVQTLNAWAAGNKLDVTKLSFPALFKNAGQYNILSAGAALGKGVGPLLIAKNNIDLKEIAGCTIAIPGTDTTANFLLDYAFPGEKKKIPLLFSKIEEAVLNGEADLGVIIHENRFTYHQRGLVKVLDLGEHWEEKTGAPIPLGCIAVKKSIDVPVQQKVNRLIRKSLQYAFDHYPALTAYVEEHAQAMEPSVMRQHIELYVNNYSLNLGNEGKEAIRSLFKSYASVRNPIEKSLAFVD